MVVICDRLLSASSKFVPAAACVRIPFPPFHGCVIFRCMYMPHFVCPHIRQWALRLLPPLALVNNAAVNLGVQISLLCPTFSSLGYIYPVVEILDKTCKLSIIIFYLRVWKLVNSCGRYSCLNSWFKYLLSTLYKSSRFPGGCGDAAMCKRRCLASNTQCLIRETRLCPTR